MNRMFRNLFFYGIIFLVLIAVVGYFKGQNEGVKEFNVHEFTQALNNDEIKEMTFQPVNKIIRFTGTLKKDKVEFIAQVPDNTEIIAEITKQAERSGLKVEEEEQPSAFASFIMMMLPFLIIGVVFFFILTRAQGGGGGGGRVMNFGKSKAQLYTCLLYTSDAADEDCLV